MAQFGQHVDELNRMGANVVFIAAEKRTGMFKPEKFLERRPAPFPFLFDQDRRVTKAYGVYHRLSFEAVNIARPATFVVDHSGVIRWMHVGSNQLDRAPMEEVLKQTRDAI